MLVVNPVERFTAGQCLEHEWVRRAGEASAKKLHRRTPPPPPPPPFPRPTTPPPPASKSSTGPSAKAPPPPCACLFAGKAAQAWRRTGRFDGRRTFDNGAAKGERLGAGLSPRARRLGSGRKEARARRPEPPSRSAAWAAQSQVADRILADARTQLTRARADGHAARTAPSC